MATVVLDWLNANALRAYPLAGQPVSDDGVLRLPDTFIVDASFAATCDSGERFFLSRINNYVDNISVEVSDSQNRLVGTFSFATAGMRPNTTVGMIPGALYAGAWGQLTIGDLAETKSAPAGSFGFRAEFEPCVIAPMIQSATRIIFQEADGTLHSVTGDIRLEARNNIRFTYVPEVKKIVIDVANGLGLNQTCRQLDKPIYTINGQPPNEAGDFEIIGSGCMTITSSTGNITITDICSQTCVGCAEAGALAQRIMQMEADLLRLKEQYAGMQAAAEQINKL